MHLFMTLLTQCYYYELLSPSFFSFLSFQISATTLTNASPITTIVSLFIVFPPFSLWFHSGNCHKEVSIGFIFTILIVIRIRCFVNAFFYFFQKNSIHDICMELHVIALPGCYLISTEWNGWNIHNLKGVNALSGCYLISTLVGTSFTTYLRKCVSMPSRAVTSFLRQKWDIFPITRNIRVNALSGCYLISTRIEKEARRQWGIVSMPSRAVTSFLL